LLKARMALLLLTPTVRAIAENGMRRSRNWTICSSEDASPDRSQGRHRHPVGGKVQHRHGMCQRN
jgi:hypothetical protein